MAEFELPPPGPMSAYHRFVRVPIARALAWVIFTLLGPTIIRSRRRIPKKGGLLILSNHQADVDPILVQLGCPRPIHYMSKSEIFEMKFVGNLVRKYYAFPVKRGEPDRASIKRAVELLRLGEVVCVFPEGELSVTGEILPLKAGVALLVRMSGAPAICVGLKNSRRMMPYGTTIPRPAFRVISANWGEPREFDKKADSEEIMAWVQAELLRLTGYPLAPVPDEPAEGLSALEGVGDEQVPPRLEAEPEAEGQPQGPPS